MGDRKAVVQSKEWEPLTKSTSGMEVKIHMKKILVVATIMALGVGTAFGSSLSVPWFLDRAPNDGTFPPSSLEGSWITITNNTDEDIVAEIEYVDSTDFAIFIPSPNTFILPKRTSYSFRPVGDDAGTEGGSSVVPNMTSGGTSGSARISWMGEGADIQGRLVQTSAGGNTFAYLLPPGF